MTGRKSRSSLEEFKFTDSRILRGDHPRGSLSINFRDGQVLPAPTPPPLSFFKICRRKSADLRMQPHQSPDSPSLRKYIPPLVQQLTVIYHVENVIRFFNSAWGQIESISWCSLKFRKAEWRVKCEKNGDLGFLRELRIRKGVIVGWGWR